MEGSEPGRFDRFLPVTLFARVWPRLPQPRLIAGADPGEARSHFTRRARGQPRMRVVASPGAAPDAPDQRTRG